MKILIVSHNPISTYQSMGKTMLALFSQFEKDELSQLYIYPSIADVDKCDSFYRITDKAVLKGILTRYVKGGIVLADLKSHSRFEKNEDSVLYSNPKNAKTYRQFIRDIAWKISPWWNKQLQMWIEKISPDCIFLAPGNNAFIYNIALKISKKYDIGIISYICDEYYFIKKPKNKIEVIRSYFVRKKIEETMYVSKGIVTICNELNEVYSNKFQKKTITIMTGTNHLISNQIKFKEEIKSITYMGNLSCHRDNSIYDIGVVLDKINSSHNENFHLDIYTNINQSIKNKFGNINSIHLHDFVAGDEFEKVFWDSELFLHVEDFKEESIDRVKHSVSTKIADILASGIPLIAYGPANIASMAHLQRNECAVCVTEKNNLESRILEVFSESHIRKKVAEKGLEVARLYHNPNEDSRRLQRFINFVYKDKCD